MGRLLQALAVVLAALLPVAAQGATSEPRLALVIANGAYTGFDRLGSIYGDGDKIAAALTRTGFSDAAGEGAVHVRRDLGQAQLREEIATFQQRLAALGPNAFGVLYYSGHGAAVGPGGDVMMVGIDATMASLPTGAPLSRAAITRELMRSGARTVLVVLDMCRNPVPLALQPATAAEAAGEEATVSGAKGLRRVIRESAGVVRPDQGYLVAYSTSPDQVAFDNGIFSRVLAEEIVRPRQNIADALKRVSDRVAMKPGATFQKPTFDYGLQGQPPCFVSCDPEAGDRFYDCANCPYMRPVAAGMAAVGSPVDERGRGKDEPLQRKQAVDRPFALGVYEVTVAEYTACVREGGCPRRTEWSNENPNPLIPATGLGYDDALAYVRWLSSRSGRPYRLPTELEWEYADRAGASGAFPWGDEISPSDANYDFTATYRGSPKAPYRGYPEAVNAYPPNSFGFYQMQGNVWEWTAGCSDSACRERVVRGGSFQSAPGELRAANRFRIAPGKRREDVGLRVARDLEPDEAGASR